MGRISHIEFKHVYRKTNRCVDVLIALERSQTRDFVLFSFSISTLQWFVDFDKISKHLSLTCTCHLVLFIHVYVPQKKEGLNFQVRCIG